MAQRIIQVDAFTDRPFAGNPAAVCVLERERSDEWMQAVAMEMNLAETAFLLHLNKGERGSATSSAGEYSLRWFTPLVEVDLCGHATLASAHVLWEEGHASPAAALRFHTRSGILTASRSNTRITLDFPAEPALPVPAPPELLEALNVAPVWIGRNRMDYLVEVSNAKALRELQPDMGLLSRIPCRGIIVTARAQPLDSSVSDSNTPNGEYDFLSRFFAPAVGVDEDPVTGSAHCCLGPYWAERLGKNDLIGYQASRRGGVIQVRVEGERVKLGGQAVTTLRGELSSSADNFSPPRRQEHQAKSQEEH